MNLKNLAEIIVNPKGQLNYIEYRVGIIALFMLLGVYIQHAVFAGAFDARALSYFSSQLPDKLNNAWILNGLGVLPTRLFIPPTLLLAWGSIVVTYKRLNALGYSKRWGVPLGIIVCLGVTSVAQSPYIFMLTQDASNSFVVCAITIISTLVVLASVVIVFSWMRRLQKEVLVDYGAHKTPMNVYAYVMKMGKWMLMSLITFSLIPVLAYSYILHENIYIILLVRRVIAVCYGIMCLIALYYYFRYAYFRLKDAGYSVWLWLVIVPVAYLALIGVCAAVFYFGDDLYIKVIAVYIGQCMSTLMIMYPLLLLVIPSQNVKCAHATNGVGVSGT